MPVTGYFGYQHEGIALVKSKKEKLLSSAEAAKRLGLHGKSLDRLRAKGQGPEFKRIKGRVSYRAEALEQWLAANPKGVSEAFELAVPATLPPPEPVVGGLLGSRNLEIAEQMARAAVDLDGILAYLGAEPNDLDRDELARLAKSVASWRAQSRFAVGRTTVVSALGSRQAGDRNAALKLFTEPEDEAKTIEHTAGDYRKKIEEALVKVWDGQHQHILDRFQACPTCQGSGQVFCEAGSAAS